MKIADSGAGKIDILGMRKSYLEASRESGAAGRFDGDILCSDRNSVVLDLDRLWEKYGAREDRPEGPLGCMSGGKPVPNWEAGAPGQISLIPEVEEIGRYFDQGGQGRLVVYAAEGLRKSFMESTERGENHIVNIAGGKVTIVHSD